MSPQHQANQPSWFNTGCKILASDCFEKNSQSGYSAQNAVDNADYQLTNVVMSLGGHHWWRHLPWQRFVVSGRIASYARLRAGTTTR